MQLTTTAWYTVQKRNNALIIRQVALETKEILDLVEIYRPTTESSEYLDHCEAIIRDAYLSTFGRELGQQDV